MTSSQNHIQCSSPIVFVPEKGPCERPVQSGNEPLLLQNFGRKIISLLFCAFEALPEALALADC